MADSKSNNIVSDAFLESTKELVADGVDAAPEDRDAFFEAFYLLQSGDMDGAIEGFRKAARACSSPFDALSLVAIGECQRIQGKEAAAIREWRKIADDKDAPHAPRYVAWLSLASIAERRDDERLLEQANAAIEELADHRDS